VSVGELARRIAAITGRDVPVRQAEERVRPQKSEVNRLLSDNRKARELAGWAPQVCLDEGLRRTVEWVRGRLDLYAPGVYRI
jgi:nucleoside-diphosphate-sugar epimerase